MIRPAGLSAGSLGLVLAWLGGAAIARLTGATPVVIVLVVAAVAFAISALDGWLVVRSTTVGPPSLPSTAVQGEPIRVELPLGGRRAVWVELRIGDELAAAGWGLDPSASADADGMRRWTTDAVVERRGVVDRIEVRIRSGGALGAWWWERRCTVPVTALHVAARFDDRHVRVDRRSLGGDGEHGGPAGAISGEIDGIRPWRDGDSERWVHWSSSLRMGELVVHDRRRPADRAWIVRPRVGTDDPDAEAGATRRLLDEALRAGTQVSVAVGDGEPVLIPDTGAAARWSAAVDLGERPSEPSRWWARSWTAEPDTTASLSARWWAAGATFLALAMLSGALGSSAPVIFVIALAVVAGAAVSGRSLVTGEPPSAAVRTLMGLAAFGGLVMVVAASGQLDGLLTFLRGPLPQVLVILILIHGFECRDRRTVRVAIGISGVVLMYAAAFRVDDRVGWWIAAWVVCAGASLSELARPPRTVDPDREGVAGWLSLPDRWGLSGSWTRRSVPIGAGLAVTLAVLAIVPVPDGPARLTLPTIVDGGDPLDQPGSLVGPGGSPADTTASPGGDRAPAGQAGGYTGFADSMDTSVRGELGDEVVMRVRAPAADFWRGQTFTVFDGRRWYADPETGILLDGPNIELRRAFGDLPRSDDIPIDDLVQTFYLETDMPNLVFHAYRPTGVVLDADLFAREDGALRAAVTLPAGSIYTVVSERARVDARMLRDQGLVGDRLTERGRMVFARQLEVPASTSPETIALADELAEGATSTYDVVRAYERWLSANVEYDLDAPLPAPGEDAVHDFLFDSRRGFCEQIASALTVMLRTQGVPARLATGYLPGTRDRVSGVFEVRASDAHAWVEVWFPRSGWQAFDPTADVPLAADSDVGSIGGDLAAGIGEYATERTAELLVAAISIGMLVVAAVALRTLRDRRRRGRWGVLQDRFAAAARRRGARAGSTNRELATAWADDDADAADAAATVADRLDRVAFAPPDDRLDAAPDEYDETRRLVDSLR